MSTSVQTIYAPNSISGTFTTPYRIFLAGSIEMGKATDWQQAFIDRLNAKTDIYAYDTQATHCFYNPRRKDWDSDWKQGFEEPQFYQQVNWELEALKMSTRIVMYFEPGTQSPISLLELGLYAQENKMTVICPEGFWRKGNVDVVCNKFGIPTFNTLEEAADYIAQEINNG